MMSDYELFRQTLCYLYKGGFLQRTGEDWFALFTSFSDNVGDNIILEFHVDHEHKRILITDSGYTKFTWEGSLSDKEFLNIIKRTFPYFQNGIMYGKTDEIFTEARYNDFCGNLSMFIQCLLSIYAICTRVFNRKERKNNARG